MVQNYQLDHLPTELQNSGIIGITLTRKAWIKSEGYILRGVDYDQLQTIPSQDSPNAISLVTDNNKQATLSEIVRIDTNIRIYTKGLTAEEVCVMKNKFVELYPHLSNAYTSCGASYDHNTKTHSKEFGDISFQFAGYDYKTDHHFSLLSGVD